MHLMLEYKSSLQICLHFFNDCDMSVHFLKEMLLNCYYGIETIYVMDLDDTST